MKERIKYLAETVLKENIYPETVPVAYDPTDELLPEPARIAKRLTEYMAAQKIVLTENNTLIGLMKFDGSVPADIFPRTGHLKFHETANLYYKKPQENLCTFEWQHSNADFGKLIRIGLKGYIREINDARKNYPGQTERLEFLAALEMMIRGIAIRADKYRAWCVEKAAECTETVRKKTLLRIAGNCAQVPMNPALNFEQAIQCLYFSFQFLADSIGRPDQYLYPLYKQGLADGTLTRDHAKELIQELFIMIHGYTPCTYEQSDRGAESHFVVGGYTIDGECAFNELSALIVESMMELPLIRPQVSLRWNAKTPREILYLMMDYERRDKNKRVAFVNDEPRMKSIMEILGYPYEIAYDYIMVGCNEPAFQGGISLGGNTVNILRSMTNTLSARRTEVLRCPDFNSFYTIYEEELFKDLETVLTYSNRFNMLRSRDCNVLSSLLLDGCIERAQTVTKNGAKRSRWCANLMGAVNAIDSLCVIRQFVFKEKRISMKELLDALDNDWKNAETLRQEILRDANFFGNNDAFSNETAQQFYRSIFRFASGRTDIFGNALSYGNLTGYHPHFAWFGAQTPATPDGRIAGSALSFGSGQCMAKEHEGISSHLLAVAKMDPTRIMCGNSIMNISVEEETVRKEESFEKLVALVETYFKEGGLHLQLNHVSREDMLAAQTEPDRYKSLRVRVSGFSATFVKLQKTLQDNVIDRTVERV